MSFSKTIRTADGMMAMCFLVEFQRLTHLLLRDGQLVSVHFKKWSNIIEEKAADDESIVFQSANNKNKNEDDFNYIKLRHKKIWWATSHVLNF